MPSKRVLCLNVWVLLAVVTVVAALAFVSARPGTDGALAAGLTGDANCDGQVDSIDALVTLQLTAGLIDTVDCPENADVNGDGEINALDAALILQHVADLIQLPEPDKTPEPTATPTLAATPTLPVITPPLTPIISPTPITPILPPPTPPPPGTPPPKLP